MNLDDFIKLYTGIPCDFDNAYGTQCMDLMHFYKYIVLGIHDKTTLRASTALNAWNLSYPQYFKRINNVWGDPSSFPIKGDIIFWGSSVGSAGHVAICYKADGLSIQSFDANWPKGSYPKLVNHTYNGVMGWMRPLVSSTNTTNTTALTEALQKVTSLKDALTKIDTLAENALK
jgi:hypothetical protein